MVTITVMISTLAGLRLLAASSERNAALMAERTILSMRSGALPMPVWVQCANAAVTGRLTSYLAGLQHELATVESA